MRAGTVREWHPDDGWGVIDSPETPSGPTGAYRSALEIRMDDA